MRWAGLGLSLVLLRVCAWAGPAGLSVDRWLPAAREVVGIADRRPVAVGHPRQAAEPLVFESEDLWPAGQYELRLRLRPSHTSDAIAWSGGLDVSVDGGTPTRLDGIHFSRVNQPEDKVLTFVHEGRGPMRIVLTAVVDAGVFEREGAVADLKAGGGPTLGVGLDEGDGDDELEGLFDLVAGVDRKRFFYYVLDGAELRPLSRSGVVSAVRVNKIRYVPGEMLHGEIDLVDAGGAGGSGTVSVFLEHGVRTRRKVRTIPVRLTRETQVLEVDVALPNRELGHALVAVFESDDGTDRSEAAEYFNIAENFFRVAIHGNFGGRGFTYRDEEAIRAQFADVHKTYANCFELFAWAEEDMVEMSPDTEYWFSGQTCYHLRKQGLQDYIRAAHDKGIAASTYGKFIMSGYLGWKTAYDYPNDHKGQYFFPVGMWEGANVGILDRFKYKDFVPYAFGPSLDRRDVFDVWWQGFMPINPDHTPRMVRIAAEEMVRSIEMFGWDGVRWDGHPRGGGQCGGQGTYDYRAARKTQTLVRYFKDVVGAAHPGFQHGYNYFFVQDEPDPEWGREDFELDELCRGGGLMMNESIRNSAGRPFEWIARNLQVEGDLCRERGGLMLGISCDGESERDELVEAILYFAGGCRPMGQVAGLPAINRYGTRYSQYTFDETLCRLATPGDVIRPVSDTRLWWEPFVYETRETDGVSQLVVNLLNVPRQEAPRTEGAKQYSLRLNPGTDPVAMQLTLPASHRATAAHLIDPFTLRVTPAPVRDGRIDVPPVALWRVLVVDMAVREGAVALAATSGPPVTFGVPRPDQAAAAGRAAEATLDIHKSVVEVNKDMSHLFPGGSQGFDEEPELAGLSWEERNGVILTWKQEDRNQAEAFIKGWWKGGSLPADLALRDSPPSTGDLAPHRNGRLDVYYARGSMDYRMRMFEALFRSPRTRVREARLGGARANYWLNDGVSWHDFPDYDLLVYLDIPHCAIGAENSYALVPYVKAGGGVLFTGGECAFGKGGYTWTVLDRELLPVMSVETVDTRYVRDPLVLEPGPDLDELDVALDFSVRPRFWSWNQVGLKPDPGIKVFLVSGNRPLLVGWQLGQGRVACFLAQHRGKSEGDTVAFFDWGDWPDLMAAVVRWLTPHAADAGARPATLGPEELAVTKEELTGSAMEDMLNLMDVDESPSQALTTGDGGSGPIGKAQELAGAALEERTRLLRRLLTGEGEDVSTLLAEQLETVANLPVNAVSECLFFGRFEIACSSSSPLI